MLKEKLQRKNHHLTIFNKHYSFRIEIMQEIYFNNYKDFCRF